MMKRWLVAGAVAATVLSGAGPAAAAEGVDEFVRQFAAEHMDAAGVPGMVFVMVDSTGPTVSVSAGVADRSTGREMDLDTALRVGSLSKPVTAALALESAAHGVVDLDVPIDRYLGVDGSDRFGPASTLRQLLTHRGGYSDAILSSHHVDPGDAAGPADWVARLGDRSMAPGVVASYSSVGYTVAGAALAGAYGEQFDIVARRELFEPLGMDGATFRQPAPPDVALGYSWDDGGYRPYPLDVPDLVPGAGLVARGRDMAAFLEAVVDPHGPLEPSTRSALLTRLGPEEGLRGYTLGLTEWRYDTRSVLYHEGNGIGTTTRLMILPDLGIGVFTAVNGEALVGLGDPSPQTRFLRDLHAALVARYLGGPWALRGSSTSGEPAGDVDGSYLPSRVDESSFMRLEALTSQFEVSKRQDGAVIDGAEYLAVADGAFVNASGRIVFIDGPDGVYATRGGTTSFRRAEWWETVPVATGWLGGAVAALLAGVAVGVRPSTGLVRWAMISAAGLTLAFVTLVGIGVVTADVMDLFTGVPALIRWGQVVAAGLLFVGAGLAWTALRSGRTAPARVVAGTSMVALAALAVTAWAWVWGLLPI